MRLCLALPLALGLSAAAPGCARTTIVGLHCEGGVKDTGKDGPSRYAGMGGECLRISDEGKDGHPDTIGTARWVTDYQRVLVVRRAGKDRYGLFLDGAQIGTIEHDDTWIRVLFSSAPPDAKFHTGRTYRLRSDAPGWLI